MSFLNKNVFTLLQYVRRFEVSMQNLLGEKIFVASINLIHNLYGFGLWDNSFFFDEFL